MGMSSRRCKRNTSSSGCNFGAANESNRSWKSEGGGGLKKLPYCDKRGTHPAEGLAEKERICQRYRAESPTSLKGLRGADAKDLKVKKKRGSFNGCGARGT